MSDLLDDNLDRLLRRAREAPRIAPEARRRILARLESAAAGRRSRRRSGLRDSLALGVIGLAAAVVLALISISGIDRRWSASFENSGVGARRVALPDGSLLYLNEHTLVRAVAERRLELVRGEILVDVAKAKQKFSVRSPGGETQALGTRFLMSAREASTETAVVRGSVRVESAHGAATIGAGERAVVDGIHAPEKSSAPRLSHLSRWAETALAREIDAGERPLQTGTLIARPPGWDEEMPLGLRSFDLDVVVENQVARTTVDQTFVNATDAELEGVYTLAIPPDAAISRLGMYVDGRLMEGAIADRQLARRIYDSILESRRDPALLEWSYGNVFKISVFPIAPRSEKRVFVSYTHTLPRLYDGYRLSVPIPRIAEPVERARIRLRLVGARDAIVSSSTHAVSTRADGNDRLVEVDGSAVRLDGDFVLDVEDGGREQARLARAELAGSSYVVARVTPGIDGAADVGPRRWVVLLDTSASRNPLELLAERFVATRLLDELDERDELALVAFDTTVRELPGGIKTIGELDPAAVKRFLTAEASRAVGATDLEAALRRAAEIAGPTQNRAPAYVLYLGDGVVSNGQRSARELANILGGRARFIALTLGANTDTDRLRALADLTGGSVSDLSPGEDLRWRTFDLVAALRTPRLTDVSAELVDAHGAPLASDAYASARQLAQGEELELVARLKTDQSVSAIRVRGRLRDTAWSNTYPIAKNAPGAYAPRLWARRRIAALMREGAARHKDEIRALGLEHFLITPFTSLLVLENDEMYRRFALRRPSARDFAHYPAPERIAVRREPPAGAPVAFGGRGALWPASFEPLATPEPLLRRYSLRMGSADVSYAAGFGSGFGSGHGRLGGVIDETRGNLWAGEDLSRPESEPADLPIPEASSSVLRDITESPRGDERFKQPEKAVERDHDAIPDQQDLAASSPETTLASALFVLDPPFGGVLGKSFELGAARDLWAITASGPSGTLLQSTSAALDDIVRFVPGMHETAFDVSKLALTRAARGREPRPISPEARTLLGATRRAMTAARYDFGEEGVLEVDSAGHFVFERVTPLGLGERVVYDGSDVYHVYAELGLATRRHVGAFEPALFAAFAPFVMPLPETLARFYALERIDGGSLRLSSADGGETVIRFDAEHRPIEIRAADRSVLRFEHGSGSLALIRADGIRIQAKRSAASEPVGKVELGELAVLDLPLLAPDLARSRSAAQAEGSDAWQRAMRQRLASEVASGNRAGARQTLEALAAHDALGRADAVLGAKELVERSRPWTALQKRLGARDPVLEYVRASRRLRDTSHAETMSVPGARSESLIAHLTGYRRLLAELEAVSYSDARAERESGLGKSYRAFAAAHPRSPLRLLAAERVAQTYPGKSTDALWDDVAKVPGFEVIALYSSARDAARRGDYAAAEDRYERGFERARARAAFAALDADVRRAFEQGPRGLVGFDALLSRAETQALAESDSAAVLFSIRVSIANQRWAGLDRALAKLRLAELDRDSALALVDALLAAKRRDAVERLLEALAPEQRGRLPEIDQRLAEVAESAGDDEAAMRHYQKLLDSPRATANAQRGAFAKLAELHMRAVRRGGQDVDRRRQDALALLARWQRAEPNRDAAIRDAAELWLSVGEQQAGWRELSTLIERKPDDVVAYTEAARVLESHAAFALSERLWADASRIAPDNPMPLLSRAQVLLALGERDRARALARQIAERSWDARYAAFKEQAKKALASW